MMSLISYEAPDRIFFLHTKSENISFLLVQQTLSADVFFRFEQFHIGGDGSFQFSVFRQEQNPISYFPPDRFSDTSNMSMVLYSNMKSVFYSQEYFQDLKMKLYNNKTHRKLHLVVCTLRMEISFRNVNSLSVFLQRT